MGNEAPEGQGSTPGNQEIVIQKSACVDKFAGIGTDALRAWGAAPRHDGLGRVWAFPLGRPRRQKGGARPAHSGHQSPFLTSRGVASQRWPAAQDHCSGTSSPTNSADRHAPS